MDAKELIGLRKEAEKVVQDMADGDLKVKAFEVILKHLMEEKSGVFTALERFSETIEKLTAMQTAMDSSQMAVVPHKTEKEVKAIDDTFDNSLAGRVLVLKEEKYFANPKTLQEIRQELATHGWHYPSTALSGALLKLVQKRKLRRQSVREGKKSVWKYSNP